MGVTTFARAYVAGSAPTVAPLIQQGTGFDEATKDAPWSGTPSIAVMGSSPSAPTYRCGTGLTNPLFWTVLLFPLTPGFVAASPVNAAPIAAGVKAGTDDPAGMNAHASD